MTTVARHARTLSWPYLAAAGVSDVIRSAKRVARAIVADPCISTAHKLEVLSLVQWKISEANGKYSTRYRSAEVVRLAGFRNPPSTRIQHEHVYTRIWISRCILAEPGRLDEFLDLVEGCIVTSDEHRLLKPHLEGWGEFNSEVHHPMT